MAISPAKLFEPGGRLDARRAIVFARSMVRQGLRRVRTAAEPVLFSAIGAGFAWWIAHDLLKQTAPFFAPLATWICLGFTKNRAPRTVVELGIGSTVGVGLGELFAWLFGSGPWQMAAVVFIAALAGRLLDRGDVFTFQIVGNGLVIVGMAAYPAMMPGSGLRWIDALVGASVAFIITVVLPRTVAERPRRYAKSALDEVALAMDMLGSAIKTRDIEAMMDAGGQLRAVGDAVTDWQKAVRAAADVAALNPTLRSEVPQLDELDRMVRLGRRVHTTLLMLMRQAVAFTEQAGEVPDVGERLVEAAAAVRSLSGAVGAWNRPIRARVLLGDASAKTSPSEIESDDWRPAALMSLVRTLFVDLLQLTGLSHDAARSRLAATLGAPFAVDHAHVAEDAPSELWGDEWPEVAR